MCIKCKIMDYSSETGGMSNKSPNTLMRDIAIATTRVPSKVINNSMKKMTLVHHHFSNYSSALFVLQEPVKLDPRLAILKIFMIFTVYCS